MLTSPPSSCSFALPFQRSLHPVKQNRPNEKTQTSVPSSSGPSSSSSSRSEGKNPCWRVEKQTDYQPPKSCSWMVLHRQLGVSRTEGRKEGRRALPAKERCRIRSSLLLAGAGWRGRGPFFPQIWPELEEASEDTFHHNEPLHTHTIPAVPILTQADSTQPPPLRSADPVQIPEMPTQVIICTTVLPHPTPQT